MNLMTLIRLVALLAIAWVLLSLGAGMLGVGAHSPGPRAYFLWNSSPHDAVAVAHPEDRSKEEYHLVDRTTGRTEPLAVPRDQKWGLLSVSPWRDQEGKLEAAGAGSVGSVMPKNRRSVESACSGSRMAP